MTHIKITVYERYKNERVFLVDTCYLVGQFLKEIDQNTHCHYQRSFFCIENNCFVDSNKTFQENYIVSFDHLILV